MLDMPRPRPQFLQRHVTRHGKVVWYFRRDRGPKIRIRGDYGSQEFNAAYQAAITGQAIQATAGPASGTLAWLIDLHRKSGYYGNLSPATRRKRDQIFRQAIKAAGGTKLDSVTKQAIAAARDRRSATPSQARHFVHTMRSLFKWAVDASLVEVDPTAGVKVKRASKTGIRPWTEDDIAKFEARWPRGTRERVMFDLFLYTGFRIGDVARLGRQHVRNGVIALDTEKTGTRVTIPILPPLAETLKAGPTGDLAFIASEKNAVPILKNSLSNAFRVACRAAGVDKSAHGLRKAAATHAADQGATEHELDALFGWTGGAMAALYTREADRKRLAGNAIGKLDRTENVAAMLPPGLVVGARKPKVK